MVEYVFWKYELASVFAEFHGRVVVLTDNTTIVSENYPCFAYDPMGIIRKSGSYPYSTDILNRKNFLSRTPRTSARKFFNFALNDSADALVLRS